MGFANRYTYYWHCCGTAFKGFPFPGNRDLDKRRHGLCINGERFRGNMWFMGYYKGLSPRNYVVLQFGTWTNIEKIYGK